MTSLEQLRTHMAELERRLSDRVAAAEVDHTALTDQLRTMSQATDHAYTSMDELDAAFAVVDERSQQVERRVETLDADQFTLTEQLRLVADDATRAVEGLDDLERELAELHERTADHEASIENILGRGPQAPDLIGNAAIPAGESDPGDADDAVAQPPTVEQLHTWVAEHISPLVRKITATGEGGGVRWCRQWWLHHEAIDRFVALYWVFRELSEQDNFGWLSVYLRDHLDPHLAMLTSPFGPFYACSPNRHSDTSNPLGHGELNEARGEVVGTALTARAVSMSNGDNRDQ